MNYLNFTLKGLLFSSLFVLTLHVTSCKKDVEGCTEPNAENYDSAATKNDGSCTYADDSGNNSGNISGNNSGNGNGNNSGNGNGNNSGTPADCPTFNTLEVTWGPNYYSATSDVLSCSSFSGRWISDMGGSNGTRVRVVFAERPTDGRYYDVIEGEDGKTPEAGECYVLIQEDGQTEWYSKAGTTVIGCTTDDVTRVQWDDMTFININSGAEISSEGKTGCIE